MKQSKKVEKIAAQLRMLRKASDINVARREFLEQLLAQVDNNSPTDQQLQSLAEFIFGKGVQLI